MKVMCMLQRRLDFLKGVVQIASCRYRSKINHSIWLPLHYPNKKKKEVVVNSNTQYSTAKAEVAYITPTIFLSSFQAINAISLSK